MSAVSCTQRYTHVGAQTKAAAIISYKDEDLFWRVGVLDYDDPRIMLNTVFFCVGLYFAFVEDKNKEAFHFNNLLVFQQKIQSIRVIHTVSMLNLF